jgi:uncharacterized protein YjgD (DUF1641 family)
MDKKEFTFNDLKEVALDDVMNLLNVSLNRIHGCTGLTDEEKDKMVTAIINAKDAVATTTEYTPKNY